MAAIIETQNVSFIQFQIILIIGILKITIYQPSCILSMAGFLNYPMNKHINKANTFI